MNCIWEGSNVSYDKACFAGEQFLGHEVATEREIVRGFILMLLAAQYSVLFRLHQRDAREPRVLFVTDDNWSGIAIVFYSGPVLHIPIAAIEYLLPIGFVMWHTVHPSPRFSVAVIQFAPLLIAVKLYELGRLSSGAAARLAGIPKPLFLTKLADHGIDTFRLTEEELQQDLASARRHQ